MLCVIQYIVHSNNNAAAAKLLQSCLTLYDPIDGSPPGSPIPGILQARTLEWVAISSVKSQPCFLASNALEDTEVFDSERGNMFMSMKPYLENFQGSLGLYQFFAFLLTLGPHLVSYQTSLN